MCDRPKTRGPPRHKAMRVIAGASLDQPPLPEEQSRDPPHLRYATDGSYLGAAEPSVETLEERRDGLRLVYSGACGETGGQWRTGSGRTILNDPPMWSRKPMIKPPLRQIRLKVISRLAGELGFEPRQTESESVVLPLHHSPIHDTVTPFPNTRKLPNWINTLEDRSGNRPRRQIARRAVRRSTGSVPCLGKRAGAAFFTVWGTRVRVAFSPGRPGAWPVPEAVHPTGRPIPRSASLQRPRVAASAWVVSGCHACAPDARRVDANAPYIPIWRFPKAIPSSYAVNHLTRLVDFTLLRARRRQLADARPPCDAGNLEK